MRDWAFRNSLTRGPLVVRAYRELNRFRFRHEWERPVTFRGASFVVGQDFSLYPAVRSGAFEVHELDWLLPQVRADSVVWDVGANIGLYSVLLAQRAAAGEVVAFEPVPSTAVRLASNLVLNGVTNVTVVEKALGAKAGVGQMHVFPDAPGCNTLSNEVGVEGSSLMPVEVVTADALIRSGARSPAIIKIDVEGFEPAFFEGARALIEGTRPVLLMEVNASSLATAGAVREWSQMVDWLFEVYGRALWFGLGSPEEVESMPLERAMGLPRAASLGFREDR